MFVLTTSFDDAVEEYEKVLLSIVNDLFDAGWEIQEKDREVGYDEILECSRVYIAPISNLHCDKTIFWTPYMNVLHRFWHDNVHLQLGLDFSVEDELAAAEYQVMILRYHGLSKLAMQIVNADIAGQVLHHQRYGEFPRNQRAFVERAVSHGIQCALTTRW